VTTTVAGIEALCDLCGQRLSAQTRVPLFFRIAVERIWMRSSGDHVPFQDPAEALLCDSCASQPDAVWLVLEKANNGRTASDTPREEADGEDLNAGEPREGSVRTESGPGTSSSSGPGIPGAAVDSRGAA
jgi:hypothetical protein